MKAVMVIAALSWFYGQVLAGPHDYGCGSKAPVKIGCWSRIDTGNLLSELLFTDRDFSSNVYSHKFVDWNNWQTYVNDLLCRCSDAAKAKGYKFIGLRFYAECWGHLKSPGDYAVAVPQVGKCYQNYGQRCDKDEKSFACVGDALAMYIYNIRD
ncbi:predicted protein [Nematostella vectensis]|uniref:Lysozyme n=1 Tax=Nematostella vectensis TaxID=45351 RepID=A7S3F3_NEMVE|nr:uncharacterized protein LOC5513575 [Nematostella vectensis]XP_032239008.1 uncharacterized protein LOC5513575 [Nematostella vectensis]EDO41761.1 predicted protein [Nematostella vectensis]|eukprot:XP_001633824.1 predicted protein [Nematostella vectensis]